MFRIIDATSGRLIGHLDIDGHPADSISDLMWEMTGDESWKFVRLDFDAVYVTR